MFWIGVGIAFAGWFIGSGLEYIGASLHQAIDVLCVTIKSINNK